MYTRTIYENIEVFFSYNKLYTILFYIETRVLNEWIFYTKNNNIINFKKHFTRTHFGRFNTQLNTLGNNNGFIFYSHINLIGH